MHDEHDRPVFYADDVWQAVVDILLEEFSDPYVGELVLTEFQARSLAGQVRERLFAQDSRKTA